MNDFDAKMEALRTRFIVRAHRDRVSLNAALAARDYATLRNVAHGLAGMAGMFGYDALGAAASTLEESVEINSGPAGTSGIEDAAHALLILLDQLD